jgi:hypothetical protein
MKPKDLKFDLKSMSVDQLWSLHEVLVAELGNKCRLKRPPGTRLLLLPIGAPNDGVLLALCALLPDGVALSPQRGKINVGRSSTRLRHIAAGQRD